MGPPSILHIVDPADRRASAFATAAERDFDVIVWPWADVLQGAPPPIATPTWVRLDAFGDNPGVRTLVNGGAPADTIGPMRTAYDLLTGAASRLEAMFGLERMLTSRRAVAATFDKARCHELLTSAGVATTPALDLRANTVDELFDALDTVGWSSVFVKPRHGSSASGVVALRHRRIADQRTVIATTTTVHKPDTGALANQVGTVTYRDNAAIEILEALFELSTMHVERWLPKAIVQDAVCDVRIVTIAGRPCHRVVRGAPGPITNLHAGGHDVDLDAFVSAIGKPAWHEMLATARQVAALFPETLHLGVDMAVTACGASHAVLEVNSFGDLLPRSRWQGQTTYETQIDALKSGAFQQLRASALVHP